MSEHKHTHSHSSATRLKKVKSAPGSIYIKRMLHDEAIVISGSLTVITGDESICEIVAKELEAAGAEITQLGGIIGHIKATTVITETKMISVTEEQAMIKDALECKVVITLAAIVFLVEQKEAGDIIRQALVRVRERARA
jgi:hypothetical protein